MYYPEFLSVSKKSKFLFKSGHIKRLDILYVDILSGVYLLSNVVGESCSATKNKETHLISAN